MKWPARLKEITKLRSKHRTPYHVPFPDLHTEPTYPSLGNGFAPSLGKPEPKVAKGLIVSHLHKSSYQVLGRNEIQYAGRKT